MKSAIEESKSESGPATCYAHDIEEVAKQIEKGVKDVKAIVSTKIEDGKIATGRFLKRSRYAVEDGISETTHNIKNHPFSYLAIAFAAGAALGLLAPRPARK